MSLNQRYIFFIQFHISKYGTLPKHIVDSTTKSQISLIYSSYFNYVKSLIKRSVYWQNFNLTPKYSLINKLCC